MARIPKRKGQRYATKTSDKVLIVTRSSRVFTGRLIDESKGGIGVAFEGERPALAPNQKVQIRCRAGSGRGEVRHVKEESPASFRVGIKWDH